MNIRHYQKKKVNLFQERVETIFSYYFYRLSIDPLLSGVRKHISSLIEPNATVADIGCGTGELVLALSCKAKMVVGFDINSELLKYASARSKNLKLENVKFISKDITNTNFFCERHFDYAVFSMVLHQFSLDEASKILDLIKGIAKYIVLADFNIPLPKNIYGLGAKLIEKLAGGQHYINFINYQKEGGLNYFLDKHQLVIKDNQVSGLGVINIVRSSPKNP